MGFWKKMLPPLLWKPLNEIRKDHFPNRSVSYSGEGEDLILAKILHNVSRGFYIDIGCYHPKLNSNTYYFYRRGWNGINIDANPESIKIFNKLRPRDININIGIAENETELTYYIFNEPAVNTFSQALREEREKISWLKLLDSKKISVRPLAEVLDAAVVPPVIDFMDIDVEGLDMEVLRSNNWQKYAPRVILVEDQQTSVNSFEELETFQFLSAHGYSLLSKTFSTLIFVHRTFLKELV